MKPLPVAIASLAVGALLGAIAVGLRHPDHPAADPLPTDAAAAPGRRVRFYQSPMHPWIRSDKPGRCTLCGMELAPVYEGDNGVPDDPDRVVLGTNAIQVLHIESRPVEKVPVRRRLRLGGVVDDNDLRHRVVASPVDARIERLGVRFLGQEFAPGDLLAEIYSPTLLAAEREYVALVRNRGSDGLVQAARQRLLQWGILPAQIDALPGRDPAVFVSEVRTPSGGTVVAKKVYEGQYVREGETLFDTADFSTMWGQFEAYESDLPWIRVGEPVVVRVPSVPDREFMGRVDLVDPTLDRMARSARVRVELANPLVEGPEGARRLLLHRITATAEIVSEFPAVSVPRTAVLRSGGPALVFVDLGGGAFERREVRIGRVGDERIEVLDGVGEGESVVVQGGFLLDAQTQLNRPAAATPPATGAAAAVPADPRVAPLLHAAAEVSARLAADDLAGARAAVAAYSESRRPAAGAGEFPEAVARALADLPAPPPDPGRASMEDLRRWHLGLGSAGVRVLGALRKAGLATGGFRTLQCPMVDKAFPGAPRRAAWIQEGAGVRNPYFGAAMPDCGTETEEAP